MDWPDSTRRTASCLNSSVYLPRFPFLICRPFRYYSSSYGIRLARARSDRMCEKSWTLPYVKRVFGFTKVRYRGIWKNHQWLCAVFALVNHYQHRNRLAPQRT